MNIILFGATGMIGQGVLRECLLAPDVQRVLTIGRSPAPAADHPKLRQIARADMWSFTDIEAEMTGYDACFFCLGVTSAGMTESDYAHITYDITVAAAETLCRLNPGLTFIFVSGAGADSSEKGRTMWARIKGKTENAVMRMSFKAVCVFRPAMVQPLHGIRSKTASYRIFYTLTKPLLPIFKWAFPNYILSTEQIGQAMLALARSGKEKKVLEPRDIRQAALKV